MATFLAAVLVAFSVSFEKVPNALPVVRAVFEACPVESEAIEGFISLLFEDILTIMGLSVVARRLAQNERDLGGHEFCESF